MDTANRPKTKPSRPDSRLRRTIAQRSLAALGAVLLIAVCVLSARLGIADRVSTDAIVRQAALQERTSRTGEPIAANDANAVIDALLLAQRWDPGHPGTAEQLGGAYTLDVREDGSNGAVSRQWAKAFDQYSNAVVLRPTSPYSWANRAWTKYYLGQMDEALYAALTNAMRLGPWEPEVQFVVTDLGFALWETLPAEMRPKVLVVAQNAQNRYATQILAIAQKRGRLADVCKFEKLVAKPACTAISGNVGH